MAISKKQLFVGLGVASAVIGLAAWAAFSGGGGGTSSPKKIDAAALPPELQEGGAPPLPGTTFVAWYSMRDRWIRLDEFRDARIEDSTGIGAFERVRVRARFQWTVVENRTPIASADAETTGTAVGAGFLNTDELTEEAFWDAAQAAVNEAGAWIRAAEGGA